MSASEKGRSESSLFSRDFFFPSRDFFSFERFFRPELHLRKRLLLSFESSPSSSSPSRAPLPLPLLRELPFLLLSFESSPSSSSSSCSSFVSRAPLPHIFRAREAKKRETRKLSRISHLIEPLDEVLRLEDLGRLLF